VRGADRFGRSRGPAGRNGTRRRMPSSSRTRSAFSDATARQNSPGTRSSSSPRSGGGIEDASPRWAMPSAETADTSRKSKEDARLPSSGVSPWTAIATRSTQYPARVNRPSLRVTSVKPSRRKMAPRILSGSGVLSPQSAFWRDRLARNPGVFALMILNAGAHQKRSSSPSAPGRREPSFAEDRLASAALPEGANPYTHCANRRSMSSRSNGDRRPAAELRAAAPGLAGFVREVSAVGGRTCHKRPRRRAGPEPLGTDQDDDNRRPRTRFRGSDSRDSSGPKTSEEAMKTVRLWDVPGDPSKPRQSR
jgi:hypothetical protein